MRQLRFDNHKDVYKIIKNNGLRNSNINNSPIEDLKNLFSDLNKGDPNNDDTFDFFFFLGGEFFGGIFFNV